MTLADPPPTVATAAPRGFRWRRLLQFRLRTLLILTTLIAIWLGWWSYKARQQREAVAAVEATGGWVAYDFEIEKSEGPAHCPKWLVDTIGVDYFASVRTVHLNRNSITEASFIEALRAIEIHGFNITQVEDIGLENVKELKTLQTLILSGTQVDDAGLEHLAGFYELRKLDLRGTHVTDAGLEHLRVLTSLRTLSLGRTCVTDGGVDRLQKALPTCEIHH